MNALTRTTIHLHIDRLVLRGVGAEDRDAVAEELRQSLEATLGVGAQESARGGNGLGPSRHLASLRVPAIQGTADAGPRALGKSAGKAIAGGLKR